MFQCTGTWYWSLSFKDLVSGPFRFCRMAQLGTFPSFQRSVGGALGYHGEIHVIGKAYFVRQAAILLGLAKATTDPRISAALLDKAAELQVDKLGATSDLSPHGPDGESLTPS